MQENPRTDNGAMDIPDYAIQRIARCLLPRLLAYFETEEGQRELMFEGKRWYDLMRMVLHSENPTATMGTLRSTYLLRKYQSGGRDAVARIGSLDNLYLPINQAEIDVNPLLDPSS